ncbi:MAG: hypothetical protein ABH852_02280 [Methanobacteriota archaeon]
MPKKSSLLHVPRLDTILMIEDTIQSGKEFPTKVAILRRLPRKVMYQTFNLVLEYLQYSNKIFVTKNGRVVWIFNDNEKLRKLITQDEKT